MTYRDRTDGNEMLPLAKQEEDSQLGACILLAIFLALALFGG